jgi:hypothetical protein
MTVPLLFLSACGTGSFQALKQCLQLLALKTLLMGEVFQLSSSNG